MASKLSMFLAELKRRKVTRVAVVYALVGLGVIEGAQMILPTLHLEAGIPFIVIFVLFGFPLALVFAWAYEITPEGLKKEKDLEPIRSSAFGKDRYKLICMSTGMELNTRHHICAIITGRLIYDMLFTRI